MKQNNQHNFKILLQAVLDILAEESPEICHHERKYWHSFSNKKEIPYLIYVFKDGSIGLNINNSGDYQISCKSRRDAILDSKGNGFCRYKYYPEIPLSDCWKSIIKKALTNTNGTV